MKIMKPRLYMYHGAWFADDTFDLISAPRGDNTPFGAYRAWMKSIMSSVFHIDV